jgi:hypothetical protein
VFGKRLRMMRGQGEAAENIRGALAPKQVKGDPTAWPDYHALESTITLMPHSMQRVRPHGVKRRN